MGLYSPLICAAAILRRIASLVNIAREAVLMTDEAPVYKHLGWNFSDHRSVNHGRGEYVSRQDKTMHSNTVEGFFSVFKRGDVGLRKIAHEAPPPAYGVAHPVHSRCGARLGIFRRALVFVPRPRVTSIGFGHAWSPMSRWPN